MSAVRIRSPLPPLLALLALGACQACLPAPPGPRPAARTAPRRPAATPARPAEPSGLTALRREVLERVNDERLRHGRDPLLRHSALDRAAQRHAEDMLRRRYFSHVSPEGESVRDRVRATGYRWRVVGENLASGPRSPAEVIRGWMGSPAHRRILLDDRFSDLGVGYAEGGTARAPQRLWVQVFAVPR